MENMFSNPDRRRKLIKAKTVFLNYATNIAKKNDEKSNVNEEFYSVTYKKLRALDAGLTAISQETELFDKNCEFNARLIGPQFWQAIDDVADGGHDPAGHIDNFIIWLIRFLAEARLRLRKDVSEEINFAYFQILALEPLLPKDRSVQLLNSVQIMPAEMAWEIVNDPRLLKILDAQERIDSVIGKINEFDAGLKSKSSEVERLDKAYSNLEKMIGISGISKSFKAMARQKRNELSTISNSLKNLGTASIIVLLAEILLVTLHSIIGFELDRTYFVVAGSVVFLQFLLLYYFRVYLHEYRSINSQILQIDLRSRLCEFIKAYAEFSADLKAHDRQTLNRFEALIFSGIASTEEKVPTAFDGIDSIAKIAEAMRGKGNL